MAKKKTKHVLYEIVEEKDALSPNARPWYQTTYKSELPYEMKQADGVLHDKVVARKVTLEVLKKAKKGK
jgi:hypothetical protein